MSFDLVIRGDLVLPEEMLPEGYVAVAAGRIAAIGAGAAPRRARPWMPGAASSFRA
jgi:allantoinase